MFCWSLVTVSEEKVAVNARVPSEPCPCPPCASGSLILWPLFSVKRSIEELTVTSCGLHLARMCHLFSSSRLFPPWPLISFDIISNVHVSARSEIQIIQILTSVCFSLSEWKHQMKQRSYPTFSDPRILAWREALKYLLDAGQSICAGSCINWDSFSGRLFLLSKMENLT